MWNVTLVIRSLGNPMLNSEKLKEETVKESPIDPYILLLDGEEEEEELNK